MSDDLFSSTPTPSQEISLIPLINIIFLLLIFFLVAGTYLQPKDDSLDIPDSETSVTITESSFEHTKITIDLNGRLKLNEEEVTHKTLEKNLEYILKLNPEQEIVINVDQYLHASHLISIMQLISSLGGGNVAIATEAL